MAIIEQIKAEIDKLYFELQAQHRKVQAELNGMKKTIEDQLVEQHTKVDNEYRKALQEYNNARAILDDKLKLIIEDENAKRTELSKEVQALKIVVPDRLKEIFEAVKEQKSLNISAASEWLRKNVCHYMNSEYNEFHKCVEYDGSIDKEKFINDFEEAMKKEQRSADWKPSEEQIGALNYAYCELFKRENVGHNILSSLQSLIDELRNYFSL